MGFDTTTTVLILDLHKYRAGWQHCGCCIKHIVSWCWFYGTASDHWVASHLLGHTHRGNAHCNTIDWAVPL